MEISSNRMIAVETALDLVSFHGGSCLKDIDLVLVDAINYVLAKNVLSKIDMPPFRQSAMDGYAVNAWDKNEYRLIGELQAGSDQNPKLNPGEAVRIFTGAAVPDTATGVIMQEKVLAGKNRITLETPVTSEMNVRPIGEQIKQGEIALLKGTVIKGAHVGFLAGLGITEVSVSKKPSIAIIVTGNELITPGSPLSHGKIYESNGAMLKATMCELGFKDVTVVHALDDFEETKKVMDNTLSNFDVVVITGGVSVGDYDFVGKAMGAIGVTEVFYKVKQKPGKPIFFGKREQSFVFGLPGNPGAALSCFYLYVYPLLKMTEGALNTHLPRIKMELSHGYKPIGSRAQFLKAKLHTNGVEVLAAQSSAMLSAYGTANALVFVPENSSELIKGTLVETILLPF